MKNRSASLWVARIAALLSLGLGVVVWPGNADGMIPLHIGVGAVFVIAMLVIAVQAIRSKLTTLGAVAVVWAIALPILGLAQGAFPESMAMVAQLLHLALGAGAWVFSEVLASKLAR